VALVALGLTPLIARMHSEEKLLREHFGAEYEAYFARTWRLIPFVY
jgi:protein-S-isoprenylcysteine O-methyltransferase Ste14